MPYNSLRTNSPYPTLAALVPAIHAPFKEARRPDREPGLMKPNEALIELLQQHARLRDPAGMALDLAARLLAGEPARGFHQAVSDLRRALAEHNVCEEAFLGPLLRAVVQAACRPTTAREGRAACAWRKVCAREPAFAQELPSILSGHASCFNKGHECAPSP